MSILSVQNLKKSYGNIQALKGVSFDIPEGSVFGILGPNGSGKTTFLGIVLDVLKADSGTYSWFDGMSPKTARMQLGALLETPNFYHYLNADDNLEINAAIKGHTADDRDRVLKIVGLTERRTSKFSTYSLGMKQRLAIGNALLGHPRVLVLDEPTNGLDPAGISEIRTLIRSLAAEGTTVIMASHLLDEVEKVCTHMAILKRGDLLVTGSVKEVMRTADEIEVGAENLEQLQALVAGIPELKWRKDDNLLHITVQNGITPTQINAQCAAQGLSLSHLVLKRKSLEQTFMELTGGESGS
ncbi:MAG: ABC transporter ATP-binding protein [Chitinophagaceae bacterium]